MVKHFFHDNIFRLNKSFRSNQFWSKKNFRLKNFLGWKKIFGRKNFWCEKFLGWKNFLGRKNFLVRKIFWVEKKFWFEKFFWVENNFEVENFLGVEKLFIGSGEKLGEELTQGDVESSPFPTKNNRVKLCWIVVTLLLWGCMQNFRSLGYSPGWGGSYCDYITNLSPKLGLNWDSLGLSLAKTKGGKYL